VDGEITILLDGLVDERPAEDAPAARCREVDAEYALEYPVRCPHCGQALDVVRVVRLLRTKVNFTSLLPRRGRVISCPLCLKVLSAELSVT
jgi:hypothetical protein